MEYQQVLWILLITVVVSAKIQDDNVPQQNNLLTEITTLPDRDKSEVLEEKKVADDPNACFHADLNEMCFNKTVTKGCECEQIKESVVCCNVTDILKSVTCLGQNAAPYRNIHIINLSQFEVNVSQLNILKQVDSLVITDGNITKITGQFTRFSAIKCLNISNNNISEINERALLNLNQLRILDLSANNLTRLPSTPQNATIDVKENSRISCSNISSAMDREVKFLNKDTSVCQFSTVYTWFNDTAFLTISHLEKIQLKDKDDCPENCKCEPATMHYSKIDDKTYDSLIFNSKVDCSNLGLTELPSKLPENTLYLNITNNSISSLKMLVMNEHYQDIKSLYADDNLITSIVDLEGSKFLENFTKLSLRNNRIKEIPYYILSNLEKNLNGKFLYLGGNRLTCECHIIKNLRYCQSLINDCEKILCNNMPAKMMELKEFQLCKSGTEMNLYTWIYYVIAIEVFLLVALFTKVSYDYYRFKKTGFLPYPASFIILHTAER